MDQKRITLKALQLLGELLQPSTFRGDENRQAEKASPVIAAENLSKFKSNPLQQQKMQLTKQLIEKVLIHTEKHPLELGALEQIYEIKKLELQKFSCLEIKARFQQLESKRQRNGKHLTKNWFENQFKIFVWLLFAYSQYIQKPPHQFTLPVWQSIAHLFFKEVDLCQYFFYALSKNYSQSWSDQEDQLIIQAMSLPEFSKKWTEIGLYLFSQSGGTIIRKAKAIRERWLSHLNPAIKKQSWSQTEDFQLLSSVLQYGKKWSKISKIFGNRSQHTVKNRYNKLIIKKMKRKQQRISNQYEEQIVCRHINALKDRVQSFGVQKTNGKASEEVQQLEINGSNSGGLKYEYENWQSSLENYNNNSENRNTEIPGIIFQPIILVFKQIS